MRGGWKTLTKSREMTRLRERTPSLLSSDSSAVDVDSALTSLEKFGGFSGGGVSVKRSASNKNAGFTWTVTFFQSASPLTLHGDLPLLVPESTVGNLDGAGVRLIVSEIVAGAPCIRPKRHDARF